MGQVVTQSLNQAIWLVRILYCPFGFQTMESFLLKFFCLDHTVFPFLSLEDDSPHINGVINNLYHSLNTNKESQCLIVSGESGSGKTQCINTALNHFVSLTTDRDGKYFNNILQV